MEEEIKETFRQCEMAWKRGRDYGLFLGIIGTLIVSLVVNLIW